MRYKAKLYSGEWIEKEFIFNEYDHAACLTIVLGSNRYKLLEDEKINVPKYFARDGYIGTLDTVDYNHYANYRCDGGIMLAPLWEAQKFGSDFREDLEGR